MIKFKDCFEYLGTVIPDEDFLKREFRVKDVFSVRSDGAIMSVNGTFLKFFTSGKGKIELPKKEGVDTLPIHVYQSLPKARWDMSTLDLLGGLDSLVIKFQEMHGLLQTYRFKDAKDSLLGLRGRESCFFAEDDKGRIHRIILRFSAEGRMCVSAYRIFEQKLGRPQAGTRFFSFLEVR
jgi:hypothetical protein